MKLCDTCKYRNNIEQLKPCIIYRDDCEYYEKEREDMTREEALNKWVLPALKRTWNDKKVEEILKALEQEPNTDWIPVSERLPEDSGYYLVSVIDEYDENYEAVGLVWFAHKRDYDIKESEWRELGIDETVIAWMPSPKSYKPQKGDSK